MDWRYEQQRFSDQVWCSGVRNHAVGALRSPESSGLFRSQLDEISRKLCPILMSSAATWFRRATPTFQTRLMKAGRPSQPFRFVCLLSHLNYSRGPTKLRPPPPRRCQRLRTTRLTRRIQRLDSSTISLFVSMVVTLGHRH